MRGFWSPRRRQATREDRRSVRRMTSVRGVTTNRGIDVMATPHAIDPRPGLPSQRSTSPDSGVASAPSRRSSGRNTTDAGLGRTCWVSAPQGPRRSCDQSRPPAGGRARLWACPPFAGTPLGVLAGLQGAVGHHHADDAGVLEIEVGAARKEQAGDVLVGSVPTAGPYAVDVFALPLQLRAQSADGLL